MWGETIILLLWAADKNLLSRLWAFCSSSFNKAAWSALTLYSNWKTTNNDMIRDGYHVDEVFLYESSGSLTRAIDVLRIFRQHIQMQTFTNTKRISLEKFIELCCDPDSNFTEIDLNATYELVVTYTFDHKRYKIVYSSATTTEPTMIRFPVYSEQAIRNKDMTQKGSITAAMLTATPEADNGIDVYQELTQLAGPMGNFYADTEYSVKKHHLHYTGLRVSVHTGMFIKVLDFWGNEFVVKPDQTTIKLEK